MDIHNIVEALEGMKLLAVDAKAVLKDGKVDLADLPVAMALFAKADVIVKAVEGIDQVVAEVKDLDPAEAQALLAKVLEVMQAIKAA